MKKILIFVVLAAVFTTVSCKNPFLQSMLEGENASSGPGTISAPYVEGGASLILSPDKKNIYIGVVTADSLPVNVEGCTQTFIPNNSGIVLNASGTKVVLKGKIMQLNCQNNQLAALNVQGCSALQSLYCNDNQLISLNVQGCSALHFLDCQYNRLTSLNMQGCSALWRLFCYNNQLTLLNVQGCSGLYWLDCWKNKLDADAFISIFNALPDCPTWYRGCCTLYSTGAGEENCTDFTFPSSLQAAFNGAKAKNWKMYKQPESGDAQEI
ncbi:leucine-rich repeat domain-containing protein [Treponema sp. OMZ 840]|uniref:leucine-rich repeat domain-containing protein n=1 Tax=Treponema sp. OMZ 840 TaxID=244313 RepID=UPI003D916AD6